MFVKQGKKMKAFFKKHLFTSSEATAPPNNRRGNIKNSTKAEIAISLEFQNIHQHLTLSRSQSMVGDPNVYSRIDTSLSMISDVSFPNTPQKGQLYEKAKKVVSKLEPISWSTVESPGKEISKGLVTLRSEIANFEIHLMVEELDGI